MVYSCDLYRYLYLVVCQCVSGLARHVSYCTVRPERGKILAVHTVMTYSAVPLAREGDISSP